jgi:hypothetical protein
MARRFRHEYGSGPLHAAALAATLSLSAWALYEALGGVGPWSFAAWFVAGIFAHDLVLLPLYSLLGAVAYRGLRVASGQPARVAALNHLRVPALLSALLLLVWLALILGLSESRYRADTGLSTDVYLPRWLALSGAMFLISAVAFAVRVRRLRTGSR